MGVTKGSEQMADSVWGVGPASSGLLGTNNTNVGKYGLYQSHN